MFRQNANVPFLSRKQLDFQYYLLYYQFIKNAFGLEFLRNNLTENRVKIRIYVDQIGDTKERIQQFRGYIHALTNNKRFSSSRFEIPIEDIVEIRSHDHVLLQCLDIVLGSMAFRLNDKHKEKIPGKPYRGKRTRAKEAVYKAILKEIRNIHKNFNIGMTTAIMNTIDGRWLTHYAHWNFIARNSKFKGELTKRGGKK